MQASKQLDSTLPGLWTQSLGRTLLFVLLLFFLHFPSLFAQCPSGSLGLGLSCVEGKGASLLHYPRLRLGSHLNEIAYQLSPAYDLDLSGGGQLQFRWTMGFRLGFQQIGIQGYFAALVHRVSLAYAWGKKAPDLDFPPSGRRHSLAYSLLYYGSSDGSDQFSGRLDYKGRLGRGLLSLAIENDAFAFRGLDEFRTATIQADYRWEHEGKLLGVGARLLLWTGSTKGLSNLDFGQEYDMSQQFGADYSHGILALRFHYRAFTLGLGYNADAIRRATQDNFHRLIDDGTIPRGNKSRDRLYLQVGINAFDGTY